MPSLHATGLDATDLGITQSRLGKPVVRPRTEIAWEWRWGRLSAPQWMFLTALACQFATVLITWSVWNVRESPANLPLFPTPAVPFGLLILLSLVAALCWPRPGVALHAAVFGVACVLDLYRLQPQFLSLIVLMWVCVSARGAWFGRWYLAALWLWAGLHKLLSAEWFGSVSWSFVEACGISPEPWHLYFATLVAVSELGLGLLAIVAPRQAAVPCLVMHFGILVALSPLLYDFNESVWPWNIATAVVGAWLLRQTPRLPAGRWRYAIVAALFLIPAGYYFDLVNSRLAFVLYSGNMPRALHTSKGSLTRLDGWGELAVPFPNSPRLFVQVFQQTAAAGDKLHISEPRRELADRHFVKTADGSVREISRDEFCRRDATTGEVAGVELESSDAVWRLNRSGAVLEYDDRELVVSATLAGPTCSDTVLGQIAALPNLLELKIQNMSVGAADLAVVARLRRLQVLEIQGGSLTDDDLQRLAPAEALEYLRLESVDITGDGLKVLDQLPRLEVLQVPATRIDDGGLAHVASLTRLRWLDLRDTRITSAGVQHLRALRGCEWLDLSGTDIDDDGLDAVQELTALEVLRLERTKIADGGLIYLRGLTRCRHLSLDRTLVTDGGLGHLASLTDLRTLSLQGTLVSAKGVQRIQEALPDCDIEW